MLGFGRLRFGGAAVGSRTRLRCLRIRRPTACAVRSAALPRAVSVLLVFRSSPRALPLSQVRGALNSAFAIVCPFICRALPRSRAWRSSIVRPAPRRASVFLLDTGSDRGLYSYSLTVTVSLQAKNSKHIFCIIQGTELVARPEIGTRLQNIKCFVLFAFLVIGR